MGNKIAKNTTEENDLVNLVRKRPPICLWKPQDYEYKEDNKRTYKKCIFCKGSDYKCSFYTEREIKRKVLERNLSNVEKKVVAIPGFKQKLRKLYK